MEEKIRRQDYFSDKSARFVIDWTRERFTMDDKLSRSLKRFFASCIVTALYTGASYKQICPHCETAFGREVEHSDVKRLLVCKIPVCRRKCFVTIHNTPETMLGDTAVAVNPDDENIKAYRKMLVLPLVGEKFRLSR